MSRRRSIYRIPRLRLHQKTIVAVASLVSLILAGLSAVTFATKVPTLSFWHEFLFGMFGWTSFLSPLVFILSALVLQKIRWSFAQTNVLLGLVLIILAMAGLTTPVSPNQAGSLGNSLWLQLSSFITPLGTLILLSGVFLVGVVVMFNTTLTQIIRIFVSVFVFFREKLVSPILGLLNKEQELIKTMLNTKNIIIFLTILISKL